MIGRCREGTVRQGMTLVELLVALVITGMALVAGYSALTTVIDRRMTANATVTGVARAAAVRRTIVEWLQHGQLQVASGGVPQRFSAPDLGEGASVNDQLYFVTTASTPLHRDSAIVQLYVNPPGGDVTDPTAPSGLVALLTPTIGAMRAMQNAAAVGNSAPDANPFAHGGFGRPPFGTSPFDGSGSEYGGDGIVVPLDSTVTGLHVDCFIPQPGGLTPQWVPLSSLTTVNRGTAILAVRLTLLSVREGALQPILRLPVVALIRRGA